MTRVYLLICILLSLILPMDVSAWDAGPASCKHAECSGGVNLEHIPETNAQYASSHVPTLCPEGSELYGGMCYKRCPEGWHRTAVITCQKDGSVRIDTSASKYGETGRPSCPSGTDMYGGLCYFGCPAGSKRTAVSTCEHLVRWRANTHLFIVNRALALLARESDSISTGAVSKLSGVDSSCRLQWETGLWDADNGELADIKKKGSHFYNVDGVDIFGHVTTSKTYVLAGKSEDKYGTASSNALLRVGSAGSLQTGAQCYEFGLALHYFTDITQPMHASGFSGGDVPLGLHSAWEDYVGKVQLTFPTNLAWDRALIGLRPEQVIDFTAGFSGNYAQSLLSIVTKGVGAICTFSPEPGILYTGACFANRQEVDDNIRLLLIVAAQRTADFIHSVFSEAGS
jgi:hypothetical protein